LLIVSQATEALKITSKALVDFGVMDGIIPEPSGGAHADPMAAFPAIKTAITDLWAE
jgi:acetyl-CoA carboxylase alpha subunit